MLLQNRPAKLIVESDHFVQQLRVLNVIALLIAVVGQAACDHLLVCDILEVQKLALVFILLVVEALPRVRRLGEKTRLAGDRAPIRRARGRRRGVRRDAVSLIL